MEACLQEEAAFQNQEEVVFHHLEEVAFQSLVEVAFHLEEEAYRTPVEVEFLLGEEASQNLEEEVEDLLVRRELLEASFLVVEVFLPFLEEVEEVLHQVEEVVPPYLEVQEEPQLFYQKSYLELHPGGGGGGMTGGPSGFSVVCNG